MLPEPLLTAGPSLILTAVTMKSAFSPLVTKALLPRMEYRPPTGMARASQRRLDTSDPDWGSVIASAAIMSPWMAGFPGTQFLMMVAASCR